MKYTIELTEKQKKRFKHMNNALIKMGMGFDILSLLEPIKTTNVEATNEYQIGYELGVEDGYKSYTYLNQWFVNTCFYGDEDNLFPEYKRRQADTCCLEDIITDVGFSEVLNRVKAYEEKKKAEEEIKVGDVVKFNEKCHNYDHVKSREYLVLHIFDNGVVTILYDNGDTGAAEISLLDKTGRHIDEVEQLLDKLRGEDKENE